MREYLVAPLIVLVHTWAECEVCVAYLLARSQSYIEHHPSLLPPPCCPASSGWQVEPGHPRQTVVAQLYRRPAWLSSVKAGDVTAGPSVSQTRPGSSPAEPPNLPTNNCPICISFSALPALPSSDHSAKCELAGLRAVDWRVVGAGNPLYRCVCGGAGLVTATPGGEKILW